MKATPLFLKKDQERRLLAGHCWVYSNEVDTERSPLKGLEPGVPVELFARGGRWLGHAYVNPNSLICARLISRDRAQPLSPALLLARLHQALALRERLYAQPFYRLVHGESDGLPGLVVDRYGELLVVQFTTAGMERERGEVLAALEQVARPKRLLLRNDSPVRALEGLEQQVEWVLGDDPGEIRLRESGLEFLIDPVHGQKTGWFFDQADNRAALQRFRPNGRVLDVFCYLGAWGLTAAATGAEQVSFIDSSSEALARVGASADRNGLAERIGELLQGDAFDALRQLRDAGERFNCVILDPPAFIKRRKDQRDGELAYRRLNRLGMELLTPDGLLVSSSCSHHLSRDSFHRNLQQAGRGAGRELQLLYDGGQGPDHPIHPAIPETAYLKTAFLRVL
ncbi:class I SAM-dependent rRNA methyltransferase [Thiorhodovibrio frisius]|uniref:Putative SAM-dependent methyltransferase n=1 Tax=Thiorhodovibrio frisius TaxID=631362 RepID=H8Z832_9GAMM|nr:class I SAM-dependent rRNA methyltransferase [Thiorhodovibrio frisius]EIC19967.1 putative SAM-dependent methyltransferase [Thiorhodovibrio frisius]WPL20696.1 Ribosomal RNA large subunit methyltransferase I [Thiorhodovibrio frisius]